MTPREFFIWLRGFIAANPNRPLEVIFSEIEKQMDTVDLSENQIRIVEKIVEKEVDKINPNTPPIEPFRANPNIALMYGCPTPYNFDLRTNQTTNYTPFNSEDDKK